MGRHRLAIGAAVQGAFGAVTPQRLRISWTFHAWPLPVGLAGMGGAAGGGAAMGDTGGHGQGDGASLRLAGSTGGQSACKP